MAERLVVGTPTFVSSESADQRFGAFFEDDGATGYFYALDLQSHGQQIVDALHIYNVESVVDHELESELHIIWSASQDRVALFINGYPHAVYDFGTRRGYCRTGLPDFERRAKGSDVSPRAWDDRALNGSWGEES